MVELLDNETRLKTPRPFHEEVFPLIERTLKVFAKILQSYLHFHFLFFFMSFTEFSIISLLFSLDPHSIFLPLTLSFFFFTIFAYLTLLIYMRGKKEEKLTMVLDTFILESQEFIPYDWEEIEYHTSMSFGLRQFAKKLEEHKLSQLEILKINVGLFFSRVFENEIFKMRELLLQANIQEHLEMVKIDPQNVEIHASLANSYVLLSLLYSPSSESSTQNLSTLDPFKQVIQLAITEFEIVKDYAPNDPWVYAQLAYGFRELKLTEKEIEAYETIVSLRPADLDSLFYLGSLYFSNGSNSKGLQIYDRLRKLDVRKAMELIGYYGKNYGYERSTT